MLESRIDLARLHAQTGARELAFAAIDRALAERSPMLVLLKVDHAWDGLRSDPRLAAPCGGSASPDTRKTVASTRVGPL